uniref:Uncharacterized protein n=1 Tax=Plectus sambesii TaxID=2011161 RepID=A0A914W035_9BILA
MLRQSIERIVWLQLLLCTLSALAKAPIPIEAPPIIPRSVLFGEDDDDKSNVRLSPDGTMLGYCAPHEGVMNIWIQPLDQVLDGRKTAKPVTFDKKRGIRSFSWTYLPGLILFGQDNDGDENLRLWKLNVTGVVNEPVVVSDTPGVQARLRAVSPKHPETIILALNDRDKRYHDLYTVDLLTGEKKLCFENPDYRSFVFDNDMKLRLATKENEEGAVEFFKAIYADGIIASWESYRNITFEDKDTTRVVGFDKESKNLYWIDADGYDLGTLIVHPFEDPSKKTEIFTPQKAEISTPFVHPVDYTVLAVTENYKRSHTYIINKTIEADFSYLRSQEQVDDIFVHQVSEDFDKWIVLYNFDNAPAKYYFYDRKAQQATFLFVNRPKLIDLKLSRMHAVEIVTRDELTQLCYLSLPVESDPFEVGLPQEPLPMVLSVHGGPWMRDYWGMLRGVQHFTNRGYAVLQ